MSPTTERAEVYRNLRTGTYSLRSCKTKRVVDHPRTVTIKDADFVVQPAGRAKVVQTGVKNVHAMVRGEVCTTPQPRVYTKWPRATYNPFRHDSFVDKDTNEPISHAETVVLTERGVFYRR